MTDSIEERLGIMVGANAIIETDDGDVEAEYEGNGEWICMDGRFYVSEQIYGYSNIINDNEQ